MKILRHFLNKSIIYLGLILVVVQFGVEADAKARFTVEMDSSYIQMGRTMPLHLKISGADATPGRVEILRDSFPREIEFFGDSLPQLHTSSPQLLEATYIIQSFDSGVYRMPPFLYISGEDTILSNGLTLRVEPVDVSEMEIRDPDEGVLSAGSEWYDFLPDFVTKNWLLILALIIIVGAGVVAYIMFKRHQSMPDVPKVKPIPPYELALKHLAELKEEKLWESGQERSFYTRLTDILREYLDGRFGINAMEMTSTQIKTALKRNQDTRMSKSLVEEVLEIADYVKFAKMKPLREDNIRSYEAALQFVNNTRPVVVEQSDSTTDDSQTLKNGK